MKGHRCQVGTKRQKIIKAGLVVLLTVREMDLLQGLEPRKEASWFWDEPGQSAKLPVLVKSGGSYL